MKKREGQNGIKNFVIQHYPRVTTKHIQCGYDNINETERASA